MAKGKKNSRQMEGEILRVYNSGMSSAGTARFLELTKGQVSGILHRARARGDYVRPPDQRTTQHVEKVAAETRKRLISTVKVKLPPPPEKPELRTFPNAIPFEGIRLGLCRYPISPRVSDRPPYMFCGEPVIEGKAYCPACASVCWDMVLTERLRRKKKRVEDSNVVPFKKGIEQCAEPQVSKRSRSPSQKGNTRDRMVP